MKQCPRCGLELDTRERSQRSHSHFFANLHDIYETLPEKHDGRWLDEIQFRQYLLIKAGYTDQSDYVAETKAEALRVAAYMKQSPGYSIVVVNEYVVSKFTAKSQSKKAMGNRDFQQSKTAVLELAQAMIDPSALGKAKAAA